MKKLTFKKNPKRSTRIFLRLYREWHNPYWFVENWHRGPKRVFPKDLCGWFWSSVGAVTLFPILYLGSLLLLIAISPVLVVVWAFVFIEDWYKLRKFKKRVGAEAVEPEEDQPSVIREFFKARKKKYCPLVEWVD